jgi:hypothetical protein
MRVDFTIFTRLMPWAIPHGQLFSKKKVLGHQGGARGKEQPDERQQLRILQELAFLPAFGPNFCGVQDFSGN